MSMHEGPSLKSGWLDRYDYADTIWILRDLALLHAKKAGPHGPTLEFLIRSSDWTGLLDFQFEYLPGVDVEHLAHARQAVALFEKLEPLELEGPSKTLAAFWKFAQTEVTCQAVNERFCRYSAGTPMGYPWDIILMTARKKIQQILRNAPTLDQMKFGFGPGATTNVKKKDACSRVKLGVQPACSTKLLPLLPRFLGEMPLYCSHHASSETDDSVTINVEVHNGRLQFVPKDARKYRAIVVEPVLNSLLQQGIGKTIRRRLKRVGVDLNQQDRNRYLAWLGSKTNHLATVDFSSASDTISTQVVAFLLPESWWVLMDLARTDTVDYNGLSIKLEKFSTMGNSFTFELESLIFYSLAWSCLRHLWLPTTELSIYGDDLIIPSEAYSLVEAVFSYCGFTVNSAKSFVRGPFRESCGADFYLGTDIRPYYQKSYVTPESLFSYHNHCMRVGWFDQAAYIRGKWIHPALAIFGPDGYGDGHLIGDWVPTKKRVRLDDGKKYLLSSLGWEGSFFDTYRHRSVVRKTPHSGDSLLPTFSIYVRDPRPVQQLLVEDSFSNTTRSYQTMWCDPRYLTVPGSEGYEKISVYTLHRGIFIP